MQRPKPMKSVLSDALGRRRGFRRVYSARLARAMSLRDILGVVGAGDVVDVEGRILFDCATRLDPPATRLPCANRQTSSCHPRFLFWLRMVWRCRAMYH